MEHNKTYRFASLLGSVRKASFHGAIARALPALAPADVQIDALGSIAESLTTTPTSRPPVSQLQ